MALFAVGCGSAPTTVVTGVITLDGQPLPSGRVTLVPLDSGVTAGGSIVKGRYEIKAAAAVSPGRYAVRISSRQPTGRSVPDPEAASGRSEERREVVPARYNERSELVVEIKVSGEQEFNWQLLSTE